jgi:tetratricopeptide (TPR) repeat protein
MATNFSHPGTIGLFAAIVVFVLGSGQIAPLGACGWQFRIASPAAEDGDDSPLSDESGADAVADAPAPAANEEASAVNQRDSSPEKLLGEAYQLSRTANTIEELTRMIELCEQAIAAKPTGAFERYAKQLTSWAYNRRGELEAEGERNDAALADFEKSLEYDNKRWKAFHNRAVSRAMAGEIEAALADFEMTIKLNPSYANAFFNRGELLYDQGRYQEAVDDYSRAIRLAPRDSQAYNSRGHAWYKLGDYDRAIADYSRAIQFDGENAAAYVNRGDAYGDLAQYGRAAADYRNAIRIDPKLGRAFQSAAWLMATCPEPRYLNAEYALTAAKTAIELDGENYRYLDTLAAALANAGQFEEARETMERAIELAPSDIVEVYKARLAKYEAGEPYRDPLPDRRGVSTAQNPVNRRRGR